MFQFRFEALLTTRRHAEEGLRKELSEARRALSAEQAALQEKKVARRRCLQDLRRKQRQSFRASDIQLYGPYLERLTGDIDTQQKRVVGAERKVNQKRLTLVEAMKRRKILEKLKERDQREFYNALAARERKFMDEVAARQHARTSAGSS